MKLAVVQFRDHVENATNHSYLSTYWRELGKLSHLILFCELKGFYEHKK